MENQQVNIKKNNDGLYLIYDQDQTRTHHNLTKVILDLVDHHEFAKLDQHYYIGQVPTKLPESEASRLIRQNPNFYKNAPDA